LPSVFSCRALDAEGQGKQPITSTPWMLTSRAT
jgi:hypothetical protein